MEVRLIGIDYLQKICSNYLSLSRQTNLNNYNIFYKSKFNLFSVFITLFTPILG